MSLIIASQMEPDFNRSLARPPSAPVLIDVAEDAPWSAADEADILLIRPSPAWRAPEVRRPAPWPGRLKWVYSASVGVDFYPDWLLDAPLVTCGRGVASEEIADYAIAAIYAHAKNLDAVTVRSRAQWGPAQRMQNPRRRPEPGSTVQCFMQCTHCVVSRSRVGPSGSTMI